jgi:hypothetical protein
VRSAPGEERRRRAEESAFRGGLVGIGLVALATLALAVAGALIALIVALAF